MIVMSSKEIYDTFKLLVFKAMAEKYGEERACEIYKSVSVQEESDYLMSPSYICYSEKDNIIIQMSADASCILSSFDFDTDSKNHDIDIHYPLCMINSEGNIVFISDSKKDSIGKTIAVFASSVKANMDWSYDGECEYYENLRKATEEVESDEMYINMISKYIPEVE